ncbi:MAG: circadian clock protein KaiB [Gammaproteobacteria bacterium]|nr:MAG: circadian clock protein KaiB [Gammaproteobacteria bacterium]
MSTITRFALFVTGNSSRAERTTDVVRNTLKQYLNGSFNLEVIDVLSNAASAERHEIFATPTLIRLGPPPNARVIGDLSSSGSLAAALHLRELAAEKS